MGKDRTSLFASFELERFSGVSIYRQLYDELRSAILAGRLKGGIRLPSARDLAAELGVSRNTVTSAFSQLRAEGYLHSTVGSGTYVTDSIPDRLLQVTSDSGEVIGAAPRRPALSERGQQLASAEVAATRSTGPPRPFRPGLPALDAFPEKVWERLISRHLRQSPEEMRDYGNPAGYRPLREAIAAYLGATRGVSCSWEQVVVVSGIQLALNMCAQLLTDAGDAAWVENPGYLGARQALYGSGARLVPVPVDGEGLRVEAGLESVPDARLAYVTPSHQQPLGVTMSLERRLSLLEWAANSGSWILEDDYDAEYRYSGRPLSSLRGLDGENLVIYLGSFSKILFPGLRLGYIVAPPNLVEAFATAHKLSGRHSSPLSQAALADFISEGHLARHLRRMRTLYAERKETLVRIIQRELGQIVEVHPPEAGIDLVAWLPEEVDDRLVSREAYSAGVEAPPLSAYYLDEAPTRGGLLLGYGAFKQGEMRTSIRRLAAVLHNSYADNRSPR